MSDDFDFENEPPMDSFCPACGEDYDEIDYEYQICHYCGHKNKEGGRE